MKDRIRQIMESQHMNQQSFASFIGLSPATLSSILQERTRPTLQTVESLQKKFPTLNLAWLINGDGDMFITPDNQSDNRARVDADTAAPQPSAQQQAPGLFDFQYDTPPDPQPSTRTHASLRQQSPNRPSQQPATNDVKLFDKPLRKITEIRVFYDDQTWESFVPKK